MISLYLFLFCCTKDWIHKALAGGVPTPAPSSEVDFSGHMWAVTSGPCTVDADGCVRSPGYPANYGMREKCRIAVDLSAAAPIRVDLFATEEPYDHLEVNCKAYAGKPLAKKGAEVSLCSSETKARPAWHHSEFRSSAASRPVLKASTKDIYWIADGSMQEPS